MRVPPHHPTVSTSTAAITDAAAAAATECSGADGRLIDDCEKKQNKTKQNKKKV